MKRSQRKPLDETARTPKKGHLVITPLCNDPFSAAMRAACVREDGTFSSQPLLVNALDSGCWLSTQVAYWPKNEAIGRRVYAALQKEDGMHSDTDGDPSIHLIRAFMYFEEYKKKLCKLLKVSKLSDLGVLRHVTYDGNHGKRRVDYELLDVREFRLDIQY